MTKISTNSSYTTEQTNQLLELYEQLGSEELDKIATVMSRPVKSIVAKLAFCGVYKKPEKVVVKKRSGPSKKEMLLELEKLVGFNTVGFSAVKKEDIQQLIDFVKSSNHIEDTD